MAANSDHTLSSFTDVIVIGGGPAGSAAAIGCIQAGLTCRLLTYKSPTGLETLASPSESIHPGINSLMESLLSSSVVGLASRSTYRGVRTGNNISLLGKDEKETWEGHHVDRRVFDSALLKRAKEQGVNVMENKKVLQILTRQGHLTGVETSGGDQWNCHYLIDASGFQRISGKLLSLEECYFSPSLVCWTGVVNGLDPDQNVRSNGISDFIPHKMGWTWLAYDLPGQCTYTCMTTEKRKYYGPPDILNNLREICKPRVFNRSWRIFRPLCRKGVLLCGDAAGILDPAAGQGVLQAVYSGMMAARTVAQIKEHPNNEAKYLQWYDDWFLYNFTAKAKQLREYYRQSGLTVFNFQKR